MKRRRSISLLVVAVGVAAVAGGALVWLRPADSQPAADGKDQATGRATVTRQDLVARQDVDGTLGYAAEEQILNNLGGTLTGAAAVGSTVDRGQTLYWVDNRPVPLFFGDLPAWRRLGLGAADGPDVRQLEANLVALGFASEADLKVDDTFTAATGAAIRKWQQSIGVLQTGAVEPGEVVFAAGPLRIKSVREAKGSVLRPGAPVLTATSTTRVVNVDLDASKQGLVKVGDKVEVRLPDGKTVAGTVSSVASVARTKGGDGTGGSGTGGGGTGGGGKPVIPVQVSLDDASAAGSLDEAPVRVGIVTASRKGVLAVPVNALLALREGGYGVRVLDGATPRVVAVETGLFAKGMVEISGEGIREGLPVEVPAS